MITIYPFQTKEVRDLAWACFSPPLLLMADVADQDSGIADCRFALTPQRQLWLEQLDRDAGALLAHLAQSSSHRLGVYFEQLWQFFLQQDPEVTLVAHNLPVHHQGRTLGEFDCLYFCHRRQCHVHLELAIKFFLGRPTQHAVERVSGTRAWLGPDARDRLDLKLDHLLRRQIQLGAQPVAQAQLAALGIGELNREIAFKGYLFSPQSHAMPPPAGFNDAHRLNAWVTCTELASYLDTLATQAYLILPKMQWLGTARRKQQHAIMDAAELNAHSARHFDRDGYPLLIAALDDGALETGRFFVTDANWPGQADIWPGAAH